MSKTEHPYAQVLRWIADGETVQTTSAQGYFVDRNASEVLSAIYDQRDLENFRLKPRTININGHEVPEPLRVAPKAVSRVWVTDIEDPTDPGYIHWASTPANLKRLTAGLLHETREAASIHARALMSFTTQE